MGKPTKQAIWLTWKNQSKYSQSVVNTGQDLASAYVATFKAFNNEVLKPDES